MKNAPPSVVTHRICLVGDSLIMGSLAATLRRCPRFEIAIVSPTASGAPHLDDLRSDVILFDLEEPQDESFLRWIQTCPTPLLIGVSPDTNVVRVWSGLQLEELSTQDLMDVIETQLERTRSCEARNLARTTRHANR